MWQRAARPVVFAVLAGLLLVAPAWAQCVLDPLEYPHFNEVLDGDGCEILPGMSVTVEVHLEFNENPFTTTTPEISVGTYKRVDPNQDVSWFPGVCQYTLSRELGTVPALTAPGVGPTYYFTYIAQSYGEVPHAYGNGLPNWNCRDHEDPPGEGPAEYPVSGVDDLDAGGVWNVRVRAIINGPVCTIR